jgi:hypothetical protein
MARPRLSDAAINRAKSSTGKSHSTTTPVASTLIQNQPTTLASKTSSVVPGLLQFSEKDVESHLPKINTEAYRISDPHKFPEALPQVSDSQLDTNKRLAKGALNAQESEVLALQVTQGKFRVEEQKAKTIEGGLKTVLAIRKAEGTAIDIRNQEELISQKSNQLDYNIYKTTKEVSVTAFDKQALDEKERLAQIKARSQKADADNADQELANKLKKLGLS